MFQGQSKATQIKKARYAIRNISEKDLLNIIREFEISPYKSYEKKRPKYEPTDSYFYLSRQLEKCMMRSEALNSHLYPVRKKITAPSLHVCSTDND